MPCARQAHAEELQAAELQHTSVVKASVATATAAFRDRCVAMIPFCPSQERFAEFASLCSMLESLETYSRQTAARLCSTLCCRVCKQDSLVKQVRILVDRRVASVARAARCDAGCVLSVVVFDLASGGGASASELAHCAQAANGERRSRRRDKYLPTWCPCQFYS